MNIDQWIGTRPVRIATLVFAVTSAAAFGAVAVDAAGAASRLIKFAGVVFGLLAGMGGIASFHGVYQRWTTFAAALQKVVVTILFGVCYVLVVPIFWLLLRRNDPLKLRVPSDASASLWRVRKPDDTSADSYLRMG